MTEIEVINPSEVAVSFAPRQLRPADRWRFVLRRIDPRSRDPIRAAVWRCLLLTADLAGSGALASILSEGRVPLLPMVALGVAASVVQPYRLWRIERLLLGRFVGPEAYAVTLGPAGATVATETRVLLLRWAGATGVLATAAEVVLQFRAGDVATAPASAFDDEAHLARFVAVARSHVAATAAAQPG